MAKATSKKTATKKASTKRTLISPNGDNRYVRRNSKGQISESDDQGKSLAADVRKHSKNAAKPGHGDKGDQPKKSASKKATSKKATTKKAASKKAAPKKGK